MNLRNKKLCFKTNLILKVLFIDIVWIYMLQLYILHNDLSHLEI